MSTAALPLPPFYRAEHAEDSRYDPNQTALLEAAPRWRALHGVRPASEDRRNVHLLLIDVQRDFCFPEGSLYVAGRSGKGALEDNRRIAEFIYRNLGRITRTTVTMDSHLAFQIFFPSFWVDREGQLLHAHRTITTEQIRAAEVRPNPEMASWLCGGDQAWLTREVMHYCETLERGGKYTLYLWPPHCIVGSTGHALAGVVHEARMFHAYARGMQAWVEAKGEHPLTENYSVLAPEVREDQGGKTHVAANQALMKTLLEADALYVAGQASSHCVKSSVDDLLTEIERVDARLAKKVFLLTDCMSAVTVPDGKGGFVADFTPQAEAALARFAAAGMQLVRSTEPLAV